MRKAESQMREIVAVKVKGMKILVGKLQLEVMMTEEGVQMMKGVMNSILRESLLWKTYVSYLNHIFKLLTIQIYGYYISSNSMKMLNQNLFQKLELMLKYQK